MFNLDFLQWQLYPWVGTIDIERCTLLYVGRSYFEMINWWWHDSLILKLICQLENRLGRDQELWNLSSRHCSFIRISVTILYDYFSIFGHLQLWKLAQKCSKFAKLCLAFCQIRNKLSKICQILVYFCQSSKILPNLVTLISAASVREHWQLSRTTF